MKPFDFDNEQAIVWIHLDRALAIIATCGFIASFVIAIAFAMV